MAQHVYTGRGAPDTIDPPISDPSLGAHYIDLDTNTQYLFNGLEWEVGGGAAPVVTPVETSNKMTARFVQQDNTMYPGTEQESYSIILGQPQTVVLDFSQGLDPDIYSGKTLTNMQVTWVFLSHVTVELSNYISQIILLTNGVTYTPASGGANPRLEPADPERGMTLRMSQLGASGSRTMLIEASADTARF